MARRADPSGTAVVPKGRKIMRHTPRWLIALAAGALVAAGLTVATAIPASATTYANATSLTTWVPEYSNNMWEETEGFIDGSHPTDVIANWGANTVNGGAGGPGTGVNAPNGDATEFMTLAQDNSSKVWGYIATNYGTAATGYTDANIETQMTQWKTWYGVTDFFLDQVPTATTDQAFYSTLVTWMKANISSTSALVLNMGAYPASTALASWMTIATTNGGKLMDWENGAAPTTPPSGTTNYPASDFLAVINGLSADAEDCQLPSAAESLEQNHFGGGFVTNDDTYQTAPDTDTFDLMSEIMESTVTNWDIPSPFSCTYGNS
jgi:hypothetical protein